jgi:hypothetical protein
MALDAISQIGQYIGERYREQDNLDRNLSPEDAEFINTITTEGIIIFGGDVKGYKLIYGDDSFILDNNPQGELDSAVYKLDGGYRTPTTIYFPLTYPIYWDQGYREIIFTKSLIE